MRKYKEELAAYYQKQEEEARKRGDIIEELVEEYQCEICKKTFKSEGSLNTHLQTKKHKDAYQKYLKTVQLDEEAEEEAKEIHESRKKEWNKKGERLDGEALSDKSDISEVEEYESSKKKKDKKKQKKKQQMMQMAEEVEEGQTVEKGE